MFWNKKKERTKKPVQFIAVASGKGGVGKSSTSVLLAYALKEAGYKVGLIDADIYGPSVVLMTGVQKSNATKGQKIVAPEVHGISVMSSAMFIDPKQAAILRGPMATQIIRQFFQQVDWQDFDFVIVDYPPGTGDIQLSISQMKSISGAVLVTTPQKASLSDVRKAASMFVTLKVPLIGIVETMSYFICDTCSTKHELFTGQAGKTIAEESKSSLLCTLPFDKELNQKLDNAELTPNNLKSLKSSKYVNEFLENFESSLSSLQDNSPKVFEHNLENPKFLYLKWTDSKEQILAAQNLDSSVPVQPV